LFAEAERRKTDTAEIRDERLRWLRAKREREEIALGRERGALIPMDDAVQAFSEVSMLACGRFLRLPQVAPDLEGKTAAQISQRLDLEVRAALDELSRQDPAEITNRIKEARGEKINHRKAA
jgi:hypothetical protein